MTEGKRRGVQREERRERGAREGERERGRTVDWNREGVKVGQLGRERGDGHRWKPCVLVVVG